MNYASGNWREIPPVPWDPGDVWLGACPTVTNYLMDSFEKAFGMRPVDVEYNRFPDGYYATLRIDGTLETDHNYWGMLVSSKLLRSGLDLAVSVT